MYAPGTEKPPPPGSRSEPIPVRTGKRVGSPVAADTWVALLNAWVQSVIAALGGASITASFSNPPLGCSLFARARVGGINAMVIATSASNLTEFMTAPSKKEKDERPLPGGRFE